MLILYGLLAALIIVLVWATLYLGGMIKALMLFLAKLERAKLDGGLGGS